MISYITISRQHGSQGARIGRELARRLDWAYYDKELLRERALESGWAKTLLDAYGERHASSLLLSLSTGAYSFGYYNPEEKNIISQKAYQAAFETIKEVAAAGPAVIVGRCADHVLRRRDDCLNLFVHAPLPLREAEVAERECLDEAHAREMVRCVDSMRRGYYGYYSGREWGAVDNYHMTLDSSLLGPEGTAALVQSLVLEQSAPVLQRSEIG